MKFIYLISRIDYVGYDEYDGSVVCANSKKEALTIEPIIGEPDQLSVMKIGLAAASVPIGKILASFNAG